MKKNWFAVKFDDKTQSEYVIKIYGKATKITRRQISLKGICSCQKTRTTTCALSIASRNITSLYIHKMTTSGKQKISSQKIMIQKYATQRVVLGKNPLETFVSNLCKKVSTSKHYTNHCVCVSNASILIRSGLFTDKEIMEMMGHKSVQSLTIYKEFMMRRKLTWPRL